MPDDGNNGFSLDVALMGSVKRAQMARGSRQMFLKRIKRTDWPDKVSNDLAGFIPECDSFYPVTASADDQPYIQQLTKFLTSSD